MPCAISSFVETQSMVPVVAQRATCLGTVILSLVGNADWPVWTNVRGITTPVPTTEDEWERTLTNETYDWSCSNRIDPTLPYFPLKGSREDSLQDCAHAIDQLLQNYGIKNLVLSEHKGFLYGCLSQGPAAQPLIEREGSVENIMRIGSGWPWRRIPRKHPSGKGGLEKAMVLAKPGKARPHSPSF